VTLTAEDILRRASQLRQAGRVDEAIAAYHAFLALRPDSATSWFNLGWLQRRARRFEEALAAYGEALRLGIDGAEEVHLNRAAIYSDDLARPGLAEAELQAALALNPFYVPALLNLGNLREDLGDRPGAAAAYEAALAAEPENALALARLAGVTPADGRADPLVRRLREALSRLRAAPADKADLGFALGQRLDAAAAYDEAFAAYAAANEASRAAAGPAARYDPGAHEAFVGRLISAFPRAAPPGQSPSGAPVFICGMFRSGSTLAEQVLAAHSRVTAGGELDLLPALIRDRLRPYPESAADPPALHEVRTAYLDGLRRIHTGSALVTDKRPDNFLHIGLIKALFPDARIVHTVRSPLDNCLSVWFLHLDPAMSYALDLGDIAHWYRQYRRLMAHWKALYPDDIHDLDYDALVAEPRPQVEALLRFLGLPWEEDCLSFYAVPGAVKTASVWQVRQPLYLRSSGRWRNYERHIGPLREALDQP
jgi:tetratricopeptide (TPR) repeat protein